MTTIPTAATTSAAALRQRRPTPTRVVVKLGTNVIMRHDGRVALGLLCGLVESIAALRQSGIEVLLVSSGAIGLGMERLGLTTRPTELPLIQACAATGQSRLMSLYDEAFETMGCRIAQVLLTEDDFRSPHRHANLRATLRALLALGVIPIVNENDSVSTVELDRPAADTSPERKSPAAALIADSESPLYDHDSVRLSNNDAPLPVLNDTPLPVLDEAPISTNNNAPLSTTREAGTSEHNEARLFGDNDKLSALLMCHIEADLLVLLSDIDGLYDRHPSDPDAKLIPWVSAITPGIRSFAHGGNGRGRGGMASKLEAARIVMDAGRTAVIANGRTPHLLEQICAGDPVGTIFLPRPR